MVDHFMQQTAAQLPLSACAYESLCCALIFIKWCWSASFRIQWMNRAHVQKQQRVVGAAVFNVVNASDTAHAMMSDTLFRYVRQSVYSAKRVLCALTTVTLHMHTIYYKYMLQTQSFQYLDMHTVTSARRDRFYETQFSTHNVHLTFGTCSTSITRSFHLIRNLGWQRS